MENGPFIDDFPIKTSIYEGFSMAMLNNQRVPHLNPTKKNEKTLRNITIFPNGRPALVPQRTGPAGHRSLCRRTPALAPASYCRRLTNHKCLDEWNHGFMIFHNQSSCTVVICAKKHAGHGSIELIGFMIALGAIWWMHRCCVVN